MSKPDSILLAFAIVSILMLAGYIVTGFFSADSEDPWDD